MNKNSAKIREWQRDDTSALTDLLDADADPLWVDQFFRLHGPRQDGRDWQRTVVAVDDTDRLLGCASIAANALHPGRFPCAIDVHPRWRRRGLGTALLRAVKAHRPVCAPLSTKARASNRAAMAFLTQVGATAYQHCPGAVLDPRHPDLARWAANQSRKTTSLVGLSADVLASIFTQQYTWVHDAWSPVTDLDLLKEVGAAEIAVLDPEASACAWQDGHVAAVAFAFAAADGFEVVAETVSEYQAGGTDLLAAAIGHVIRFAAKRSDAVLTFDGHNSDPHLYPILSSLPWHQRNPVVLFELP